MTWCYLPETDCHSAQEPEALIWASCLQSLSSTPDALSSGKNTPVKFSSQRRKPDTYNQPQSGMTSLLSTPDRSPEPSTLSSLDTPVSRSAKLDSAKGKTTKDTSGQTSSGSSKSSGQISDGAFSRTLPDISPLASKPWCVPYDQWVSGLRLAHSQRLKLAQRMKGSESLSWPTAKAVTGGANSKRKERGAGGPDLQAATENWPTPMAGTPAQNGNSAAGNSDFSRKAEELAAQVLWKTPDVPSGGRSMPKGTSLTGRKPDGSKAQVGLQNQVTLWKTPSAQEPGVAHRELVNADGTPWSGGQRAYDAETGRLVQTGLPQMVDALWPTPAMRDHKGENSADHLENGTGRKHLDQLPNYVAHSFSLPPQATPTHGAPRSTARGTWRQLYRYVRSTHGRATARRLACSGKARLNPLFVEWLMGWPPGHTLCDCSETALCLCKQPTHGEVFQPLTDFGGGENDGPIHTNKSEGPQNAEASSNNGGSSGASPPIGRSGSSHQRGQDRQSHRKSSSDDFAGTWPSSSSTAEAHYNCVRHLFEHIHSPQDKARAYADLLAVLPEGICPTKTMGFSRWYVTMRGALSALPTASAGWIWQPPAVEREPEQMEMF